MTELEKKIIRKQNRFAGIKPFKLPDGKRLDLVYRLEQSLAKRLGYKHAVATASVGGAIHMVLKRAAESLYGINGPVSLSGKKVFVSDFAKPEVAMPILYEGGIPVFIDASDDDWCMDPEALEAAFEKYPEVKMVILPHIYGNQGQTDFIREICDRNNAILIEYSDHCASNPKGDYLVVDLEDGAAIMSDENDGIERIRFWSHGSYKAARWNQVSELGYDVAMKPPAAERILEKLPEYDREVEHSIEVYRKYSELLPDGLLSMNPVLDDGCCEAVVPCALIESGIAFEELRSDTEYMYKSRHGTASPMEIIEALEAFGVEAAPLYKPLHLQPVFYGCEQISLDGSSLDWGNSRMSGAVVDRYDVSKDIFEAGFCLPLWHGMTGEDVERVVEIVMGCFDDDLLVHEYIENKRIL